MVKLGKAFSDNVVQFSKKRRQNGPKLTGWGARITLLYMLLIVGWFGLVVRLFHLTVVEGKENREKAIKELHRVLKPKAKAEIGVWNIKSKRFKNIKGKEKYVRWTDKGERYYYLYDEKEIYDLFKKIGFKIISTHNSEMMINFVAEK